MPTKERDMTEYERALMSLDEAKINNLFAAYQQAKPEPFSGARKKTYGTMSIASPYDTRAAEIARTTLPKIANDVAMLGANFAPGSGEYLSAQQSAEDTAKAREAFAQGNYGEAAASGANALVNAVGSLPIAHQIMALGKGAVGVAKGLMGAEHIIPAITTYHGSPTSGIRKWDLNFRGTGEGRLPVDSPARESFTDMIGHGLYSAEKEGIAKGYQDRLTDYEFNRNILRQMYDDLAEQQKQTKEWKAKLRGADASDADKRFLQHHLNREQSLREQIAEQEKRTKPGALYTTEITPHPDEFLLWDKPLSEQSEKVKAALKDNEHLLKRYADIDKKSHIYTRPIEQIKDMAGQELYEDVMSANLGSDKAASEYLHSLGISGIKYLDSSSRNVDFDFKVTATKNGKVIGEKFAKTEEEANRIAQSYKGGISGVTTSIGPAHTYNYVTFNPAEEAIITHENGQRIPGAVEEAYRKLRDPESKAVLLERYPELKDLDKPLVNSQGNEIKNPENFKNWFGESKVVDSVGKPLVVYHGSRSPYIDQFDLNMEGTGAVNTGNKKLGGVWFTSSKNNASFYADAREGTKASLDSISVYGEKGAYYAAVSDVNDESLFQVGPYQTADAAENAANDAVERYNADPNRGEAVFATYLALKNPFIIEGTVPREKEFKAAKNAGHDGIIAKNVVDGQYHGDVYVAFSPTQIKSVNNRGTFDPNNPNILMGAAPLTLTGLLGKYDKNDEKVEQDEHVKTPLAQKKTKGYANGQRIPGAVEEAYRKLRDPESKALFEKKYPELKGE